VYEKNCFSTFIGALSIFAVSVEARADLIVTNYCPIQFNIVLSDGTGFGISATTPATYVYPGYMSWSLSWARVFPHISAPTLTVGDPLSGFLSIETYTSIVPPMTTPFTVTYLEFGPNVFLTFYP
jgi:hypothetical protein